MAPINRGFITASVLSVIGIGALASLYVGNEATEVNQAGARMLGAIVIGVVLAQALSRLTEYFTSTETTPVRDIADAARTSPATAVLSGIASGLESSVWAIIAIALAIGATIGLGDGNIQFSFYLVALTGVGMLATTGIVVSEDTFGPVADNAAGIAEMSGEFEGEPERIMVSLDAVGNTTKAVTKGFAIGSAVIAAVALFASYIDTIAEELGTAGVEQLEAGRVFDAFPINVADPKTFIGLLIGGSIAFLFSRSPSGRSAAPPAPSCKRCAGSSATASWTAPRKPDTARWSTSAPPLRCASWPRRRCWPSSPRSSSASASTPSPSARSSPPSSSPVSSWPTS